MITSKEGYKAAVYFNHRLIEMQICADEQDYMENWEIVRGITLGTYMIINNIIKEEMENEII